MSDFETIPARPSPEEPKGEPEKAEEKKPKIEVEDWGAEPPAPEPEFFKENGDVTRVSEHLQPVEPIPAASDDALSAKTVAFDKIPLGTESREAATVVEMKAPDQITAGEPAPAEPVYHIPQEPRPVEPEVIETPVRKPADGGEPPKKSKAWWIILIVVLVLLCLCVILVIVLGYFFFSTTDTYTWLPQSILKLI